MKKFLRTKAAELAAAFIAERIVYYGKIVKQDPSQSVFIHGWLQRMSQYVRAIPNVQSGAESGIR